MGSFSRIFVGHNLVYDILLCKLMPQVLQANAELVLAKLVGRRENGQLCEALRTCLVSPIICRMHVKTRSLAIITSFEMAMCCNTSCGADTKAIQNETLSTQKERFQINQVRSEYYNTLKKWASKDDIESVAKSFILSSWYKCLFW